MTMNPNASAAKNAVCCVNVGLDGALPPRRLAYAERLGAAQRVLSFGPLVENPHDTQQAKKVATSAMNSEPVPTDPLVVAQSAFATWSHINDALSPIIGPTGVAGLYKRSLSLTRGAHPVLTAVSEGRLAPGDYSTLQQALAQQSAPVATAASVALLQTFNDLLTKLIGPSLTERLLRPRLDNPSSSGDAEQDTST